MKSKVLLVTLVAVLGLFATASAFAGPRFGRGSWCGPQAETPGHHLHGPQAETPGFFGDFRGTPSPGFWGVNLSEEQRAKILEIEKNFATQAANLRAQLETKMLELRELQLKEATEENAQSIRAKIGEILALRQELFALRKDMVQQILNVLTPEQLKNFPPLGQGMRWGMGRGF